MGVLVQIVFLPHHLPQTQTQTQPEPQTPTDTGSYGTGNAVVNVNEANFGGNVRRVSWQLKQERLEPQSDVSNRDAKSDIQAFAHSKDGEALKVAHKGLESKDDEIRYLKAKLASLELQLTKDAVVTPALSKVETITALKQHLPLTDGKSDVGKSKNSSILVVNSAIVTNNTTNRLGSFQYLEKDVPNVVKAWRQVL